MKAKKRIGIWMDHSTAHLIEYSSEAYQVKNINADIKGLDNQEGLQHSESILHHKENQHIKAFYKELIDVIKEFEEILIFGPTNAKTELYNLIREEHKYDHLKIEIKTTTKMSFMEAHDFIVDHFKNLLNYENPFNK